MQQESSQNKIRLICGIVLSVLIVVVGICLIFSCLSIYRSGESPFTREAISAAFSKISVPVYLCLLAIVVAGVLAMVLPTQERRPRASVNAALQLQRIREKINHHNASLSAPLRKKYWQGVRFRYGCRIGCAVICIASALPLILYLIDLSHFTPALNESVIAATYMALPFVLIGGIACLLERYLERISINREIQLWKSVMEEQQLTCGAPQTRQKRDFPNGILLCVVRAVVLLTAVVLIGMGVFNGGMRDVLGKAIKICTECIGLG